MSHNIYVRYKGLETAVLHISTGSDGSIYFSDLVSRYHDKPEYEIVKYDLPLDRKETKTVELNEKRYRTDFQPKFSHHSSGFCQISGIKKGTIISGIDENTGIQRGVAEDSFALNTDTNDGGPFLTGVFWGLNKLPTYKSKTSKPIYFEDEDIDYQSLNNRGKKLAFAFMVFHIAENKIETIEGKEDWGYYNYENFKKPLLLKILNKDHSSTEKIGISCLKARSDMPSDFGFTLTGAPGEIDKKKNTCKNTAIIFPKPEYHRPLKYLSLNYTGR